MKTEELELIANVENLDKVTEFVENMLLANNWPQSEITKIIICVEEIFVNIANYAYVENYSAVGKQALCKIQVDVEIDIRYMVRITFTDQGIPYNPLAKDDPDTTLSADDREIGGLGIFMVKKTMDDITYSYEYDTNILTMVKYW